MKNIYILPTDKPSRLFNCFGKLEIGEFCATREDLQVTNQHIYITSTDEITDCNCYVINVIGGEDTKRYVFKPIEVTEDYVRKVPLHTFPSGGWCEKIILTTDPDLIKDGVQSIDDEFLNWFVQNPSCEFVKVIKDGLKVKETGVQELIKDEYYQKFPEELPNSVFTNKYKIIIPSKDNLKIGDNTNFGIITDLNEKSACFGKNKIGVDVWYKRSSVIKFPNLVLEKMYSEDEVWNIIRMVSSMKESGKSDIEISEYFEDNKKK